MKLSKWGALKLTEGVIHFPIKSNECLTGVIWENWGIWMQEKFNEFSGGRHEVGSSRWGHRWSHDHWTLYEGDQELSTAFHGS